MNIVIKIDNRRTQAAMDAVKKRIENNVPLMSQIARQMRMSTERNFAAQGRPRWEGLSDATRKRRAYLGKTGKMLQVTGILAASVRTTWGPNIAVAGSNLIYAKTHQFGATINHPGGTAYIPPAKAGRWIKNDDPRSKFLPRTRPHPIKVPARPFLNLQVAEVQKIQTMVQKFYSMNQVG